MDYDENSGIDLHIHTTASDGTYSPLEILSMARELRLRAIAITDHDTLSGSREALDAGIPPGLEFLTGVEISTAAPHHFSIPGSLHLLGYGFDVNDARLFRTLERLQAARRDRNPGIVAKLRNLGIDITLEDIAREAGGGQMGRPHVARVLEKRGVVKSIDEAFNRYLGTGKPAYVEKYRTPCEEAIAVIRGAGGIPVLAHPGLIRGLDGPGLVDLVSRLVSLGLGGIEVHYPGHGPERTARYGELANRFGLLATGGTDFHGAINPKIRIGSGFGNFHVPFRLYEELVKASGQSRS